MSVSQIDLVVLWNIWRQRNDRVFNGTTETWGSVIARSKWLAARSAVSGAESGQQSVRSAGTSAVTATPGRWCPPGDGWMKLNSDGARSSLDGDASCGGVLRDHNGGWIRGFSKFIGKCSVVEAELWGIATGLDLAWDMGYRRVMVESDSADALRLLQRRSTGSGPFSILCYLHKLCGKDWTLVFSKVDRRNNRMVDRLAKLASTVSLDVVTFDEPLSEVVFDIG
ncbi:hypothetical protein V6N13_098264 [Hibiscus sabdariffa]